MSEYLDNEIPKYRKKSKKTTKKSKHKHDYKPCLLHELKKNRYHKAEYCTICNKIGKITLFEHAPSNGRYVRILSQEEILMKYKDYEQKEVDDLYKDKFIK